MGCCAVCAKNIYTDFGSNIFSQYIADITTPDREAYAHSLQQRLYLDTCIPHNSDCYTVELAPESQSGIASRLQSAKTTVQARMQAFMPSHSQQTAPEAIPLLPLTSTDHYNIYLKKSGEMGNGCDKKLYLITHIQCTRHAQGSVRAYISNAAHYCIPAFLTHKKIDTGFSHGKRFTYILKLVQQLIAQVPGPGIHGYRHYKNLSTENLEATTNGFMYFLMKHEAERGGALYEKTPRPPADKSLSSVLDSLLEVAPLSPPPAPMAS